MAVTAKWFGKAIQGQFGATAAHRVDWVNDSIKVALCTSTYAPNQDTHEFFSDVTNEVSASGTNYTAGGTALASKSVGYDAPTNETRLIAAAATSWANGTFTARYAVVYKDTGTPSTSPLLGWVDFGGDETVNAATFTITWDATNGVLKLAAA